MKVLFFIAERDYGITSLLAGQAIEYNKLEGIDFLFVGGETEREVGLYNRLKINDVRYKKIKGLEFHANFFILTKELIRLIRNEQFDIIHVQTNWQLAIVSFSKIHSLTKFKIIYTIHAFRNNEKLKSYLFRIIIFLPFLLFTNRIIVCSEFVRKKFSWLGFKISKLYLGVDDIFFTERTNKVDTVDDIIKISYPAIFRAGKKQELLISCISDYIKRNSGKNNIHLYLPGEGPLKQSCINLATKLEVEKNVHFPGMLTKEEIYNITCDASIAIIPSVSETFGLCIAEPFSAGRCVISRNVGVAPDIISSGINGFIYNLDSELLPILEFVLSDKQIIENVSNKALIDRGKFKWTTIGSEYKKILEKLQ